VAGFIAVVILKRASKEAAACVLDGVVSYSHAGALICDAML
jgi:hypothetical protein